jgi:siroheme synthase-like protein
MTSSFALPLVLDGSSICAVVVGGGSVAYRKVRGLLDGGASVRVAAAEVSSQLRHLASQTDRLTIVVAEYEPRLIEGATLVVAATDDATVNGTIARDARDGGRLVIVVDAHELGNCITPAVHRAGPLLISVSSGGVPAAAARIRDAIARRFDRRYAAALRQLIDLRRRFLQSGDRAGWRDASRSLISEDFCERVESGSVQERVTTWQ